jgi:hypothetical protein
VMTTKVPSFKKILPFIRIEAFVRRTVDSMVVIVRNNFVRCYFVMTKFLRCHK